VTAERLHQLTERLSSLFRASLRQAASAEGLKVVQLEALVYLSMANRYSDSPAGLTDYLGVTKGTVSQTIKALERHGLLEKHPDSVDGRVVHCRLTRRGKAMAEKAYPTALLREVPKTVLADATPGLESLLRDLQRANGFRAFGVCHSCRFYRPSGSNGQCGLTLEPLSKADSTKICREHEIATPQVPT
jgi:DNA-binding MarR family transcriptional regulator